VTIKDAIQTEAWLVGDLTFKEAGGGGGFNVKKSSTFLVFS
jgi:hypothetical protein